MISKKTIYLFVSLCILFAPIYSCKPQKPDTGEQQNQEQNKDDEQNKDNEQPENTDIAGGIDSFTLIEERPDPVPVPGAVKLADASLRIFFVGNSFTQDAVTHLPGILAAAGIRDVTLAHCYYGGRTVPEYNDWSKKDYTLYKAEKGASTWTTHPEKVSLAQVATGGRWDIITIQEHTGNFRAWTWTLDEKNAILGLIDKLDKTQKEKPAFHYLLSQAYFNMNKIGSGSKPYITWTDQAGMFEVIVSQAKTVMKEIDFNGIISTGAALQNLRTTSLDTPMNLTRDGYHMDYGTARYAAACTVYDALIEPIYKISLDNNTFRYNKTDTTDGKYTTPVTDASAPICREAARYDVEKPYEVNTNKK